MSCRTLGRWLWFSMALPLWLVAGCGDGHGRAMRATPTPVATPSPTPTPINGPLELCAQAPHDELCSFLPQDVIAPELSADGYSQITPREQRPFDNFAWQMFVALNWPADRNGVPIEGSIGDHPEAPRVWRSYPTSFEAFQVHVPQGLNSEPQECPLGEDLPILQLTAKSGDLHHEPASILQATGEPLVDRNLNFVMYDIRLNPVALSYLTDNGLTTVAGQQRFEQAGGTVSFPLGFYDDELARTGGSPGAIELKFSWRILDAARGDDLSRFYTMRALVYVPAAASESGNAFCFPATLGLVGMHIMQRTSGPHSFGLDWVWATFEHVDNAPLAQTPGDPTSLTPAPAPCLAPTSASDTYSLFNPACPADVCIPNAPPEPDPSGGYVWATTPPYARRYATDGLYGTQVVQCWDIYPETEEVNVAYRRALAGTVWANYRLINTQWQGEIQDPASENGNIPRFLANTTMETYLQNTSSCLDCHSLATTTTGQDANFSFLLGLAAVNTTQALAVPAH